MKLVTERLGLSALLTLVLFSVFAAALLVHERLAQAAWQQAQPAPRRIVQRTVVQHLLVRRVVHDRAPVQATPAVAAPTPPSYAPAPAPVPAPAPAPQPATSGAS